jgi:hypothetical protein
VRIAGEPMTLSPSVKNEALPQEPVRTSFVVMGGGWIVGGRPPKIRANWANLGF